MSSENLEAVIFDMDGVLIDAADWHYQALNLALNHFGLFIDPESQAETFNGLPTRDKLNILNQNEDLPRSLHPVIAHLKQVETVRIATLNSSVRLETLRVLEHLKSQSLKLGVATNSIRMTTELMLTLAGIRHYFEVVVTNEDVMAPKPNPEIYFRSCQLLKVPPENALVIEDSKYGLEAAREAGCQLFELSDPDSLTLSNVLRRIQGV